jgi:outer membrane protein OmpA-like peptidoglycan-associated protein
MFSDGFDPGRFGENESWVLYIFPFGKAALTPPFGPLLDSLKSVMQRYPDIRIELSGHTDSIGTATRNYRTSARRAQSVRNYLVDAGRIDGDRIRIVAAGSDRPFASNETDAGRALNRRVEFRLVGR